MSGRTKRQEAALTRTVRHLGRAMRSIERAGVVPNLARTRDGSLTSFEVAYLEAERLIGEASDRLIDAIEGESPDTTEATLSERYFASLLATTDDPAERERIERQRAAASSPVTETPKETNR